MDDIPEWILKCGLRSSAEKAYFYLVTIAAAAFTLMLGICGLITALV